MPRELMSDAELKRRKKIQGRISQTTSTLGLTGVGIGSAALIAGKKPGALRAVQRKVPAARKLTPEKLKDAGLYTSLASGGIGGVGGYNFAAYTNAESRKRQPVRKSVAPDMDGTYGEEGFAKAWEPQARNFDAESKRHNRARNYELAGAGGTIALAGGTLKRASTARKLKGKSEVAQVQAWRAGRDMKAAPRGGQKVKAAQNLKRVSTDAEGLTRAAGRAKRSTGRLAAATLIAGGATAGVAAGRRSKSWQ